MHLFSTTLTRERSTSTGLMAENGVHLYCLIDHSKHFTLQAFIYKYSIVIPAVIWGSASFLPNNARVCRLEESAIKPTTFQMVSKDTNYHHKHKGSEVLIFTVRSLSVVSSRCVFMAENDHGKGVLAFYTKINTSCQSWCVKSVVTKSVPYIMHQLQKKRQGKE